MPSSWLSCNMIGAGKGRERHLKTFQRNIHTALFRFRKLCDGSLLPPSMRVHQAAM